jgi:predicted phage gp36 major capsid-like protein
MPLGLDAADLSAEERVQRLKTMVSRLLRDLRQREEELNAALELKGQLRGQLQAATDRLAALGSGQPSESPRESGDLGDAETVVLRRRVKTLESALGAVATPHPGSSNEAELARLREQNETLLKRNAELELRVAELKAKTTFRERLLRDIETSSSLPPLPAGEHVAGASETPAGSPNGRTQE